MKVNSLLCECLTSLVFIHLMTEPGQRAWKSETRYGGLLYDRLVQSYFAVVEISANDTS